MRPKKSLGQNFLVNRGILDKIITAAELVPTDSVLEVGPGRGVLTEALAKNVSRVIAVEKDNRLIEPLRLKFKNYKNVEIIEDDILKADVSGFGLHDADYKIVANIPYYITSNLLRTIFESVSWRTAQPNLLVLMVQKEVAQRICAKEGNHSILSLSVQFYAKPEMLARVSPGSFSPAPSVDSAILRLIPHRTAHTLKHETTFFKLIKAGFAHKRKSLLSNLNQVFIDKKTNLSEAFSTLGIKPLERAQNLGMNQWLELAKILIF